MYHSQRRDRTIRALVHAHESPHCISATGIQPTSRKGVTHDTGTVLRYVSRGFQRASKTSYDHDET